MRQGAAEAGWLDRVPECAADLLFMPQPAAEGWRLLSATPAPSSELVSVVEPCCLPGWGERLLWSLCRATPGEVSEPAELEPPFPADGADAYLTVAQGRLDHQMATLDALEAKATTYLNVALAEVGVLVAVLAIRTTNSSAPPRGWAIAGVVASVLTFVLTALACRAAQRLATWSRYPSPDQAAKSAAGGQLPWALAISLECAYRANRPSELRKSVRVARAECAVTVQSVVTLVAALLLALL